MKRISDSGRSTQVLTLCLGNHKLPHLLKESQECTWQESWTYSGTTTERLIPQQEVWRAEADITTGNPQRWIIGCVLHYVLASSHNKISKSAHKVLQNSEQTHFSGEFHAFSMEHFSKKSKGSYSCLLNYNNGDHTMWHCMHKMAKDSQKGQIFLLLTSSLESMKASYCRAPQPSNSEIHWWISKVEDAILLVI